MNAKIEPKIKKTYLKHYSPCNNPEQQSATDCFSKKYFEYFLQLVSDAATQFDHRILAYCMMTNHVHLIIYIHEFHLSKIMKNINHRYACWVNKLRKRVGHLFQGRYRSIEVRDETYLINLCRYIHNNPVEAKKK